MTKKFYKNEKFQAWFFPILYFLLAVSIVITGCFIFKKKYYQPIVVNGHSMWPTLTGGGNVSESGTTYHLRYHYGLADISKGSVYSLHRFDVVVTYYPQGWGGTNDYKIKRVWGFPGETIQMTYDETTHVYTFTAQKMGSPKYVLTSTQKEYEQTFEAYYYEDGQTKFVNKTLKYTVNEFVLPNKTFRTSHFTPDLKVGKTRVFHKALANDEYFVMGDNWQGSTDSYDNMTNPNKLTANELQGRVISLNAYVTFNSGTGENTDMHEFAPRYEF